MAGAAGEIKHSRLRKKKDVQRDDFNIVAALSIILPFNEKESGSDQPDGKQDFNEKQITD